MNTWRYLLVLASVIPATWAGPIIFDTLGPLNQVMPGPGLTVGGGILRGDPPGHQGATYAEGFPTPPGLALGSIDLLVQ
jgi:hypothetical protein